MTTESTSAMPMFCRYQQQWGGTAPSTIALLGEDMVAGEEACRQGEGMEEAAVVVGALKGAAVTKTLSATWSATFRSDAGEPCFHPLLPLFCLIAC
jgi:hypothetical protein